MKDSPKAVQIKQNLAELRSNGDGETSYYASIVGPSFLGKTQTAFTLSHHMIVFYVNLPSTFDSKNLGIQPIYKETSEFSRLFFEAIKADLKEVEKEECLVNSHDLLHSNLGFVTLGLLYVLIHDQKLNSNLNVEERFFRWYSLGHAVVPKLTVSDFKSKLRDLEIDFNEYLVFIDELPLLKNDDYKIIPMIKFLRNLIRATTLISLLCGTNSQVNALLESRFIGFTGLAARFKRWVKVLTELIRANMQSLCCNIEFTSNDGKTKQFVSDFIKRNKGKLILNYNSLFTQIFGDNFRQIAHIEDAEKLLKFIFKYASTSLPGIASAATTFIFTSIFSAKSNPDSLKHLWNNLNNFMIKTIKSRKPNIASHDALIASLHVLTFPSKFRSKCETGIAASNNVNNHFFYYGAPGEESFDLEIGPEKNKKRRTKESKVVEFKFYGDKADATQESKTATTVNLNSSEEVLSSELYKDNELFVEKCHFAAAFEDPLLCLSLWNLWHKIQTIEKPTLAWLYDYHLQTNFKYSVYSNQTVPDSFSLELLAQWAISYASQSNLNGETDGLILLQLFILNIQHIGTKDVLEKFILSFNNLTFPKYLEDFLSILKIPYLLQGPPKKTLTENATLTQTVEVNPNMILEMDLRKNKKESNNIVELSNDLSSFIKFGTCHRPLNSAGWDVLFDMQVDGVDEIGYIECKLWSTTIGLPLIFPYYKKACLNNIKFSVLVAKKIQKGLKSKLLEIKKENQKPLSGKKLTANNPGGNAKNPKVEKKPPAKKSKLETPQTPNESKDYVDEIEKLVISGTSILNIYCIRPERLNSELDDSISLTGNIDVEIIKEFPNPTGVFVLIESNFSPPDRTSKS